MKLPVSEAILTIITISEQLHRSGPIIQRYLISLALVHLCLAERIGLEAWGINFGPCPRWLSRPRSGLR